MDESARNVAFFADAVCEIDYDPGTFDCPEGQTAFRDSKLVWYHCPYCRKCKMFRWSGCGGNSNRSG
jgi:Zn finger protein HypA/HybF involved in hydrogenase expression